MKILVLNTGSSSIKYQLIETDTATWIAKGIAERIGDDASVLHHQTIDAGNQMIKESFANHETALKRIMELLLDGHDNPEAMGIKAVGHRVVHGGDQFIATTPINTTVKQEIKRLFSLAPLHNPYALKGIEITEQMFPQLPQMATFDTAFHQTMPEQAFRYAIPEELYKTEKIRVYGFHGTSHKYISDKAIQHLQLNPDSKLITLHLGNGASAAAIQNGKTIDTSMGMGPLSGLIMGSRSGDIDPSVLMHLSDSCQMSTAEIQKLLNKQSGMLSIAGHTDMREIAKAYGQNEPSAILAYQMYTYRIKKYIGAYTAALNGLDALVFAGGIGENDALCRELVCTDLDYLGININLEKNQDKIIEPITDITAQASKIKVLIVQTNEELQIAKEVEQNIQA